MFVSSLVAIYFILIYLCLIFSLLRRKKDNSCLFVYFLIVAIVETMPHFLAVETNEIYKIGTFLYIGFFTFYYSRKNIRQRKMIYVAGFLALICSLICVFSSLQTFPIALGITIAVFYIFLSLWWFFNEINNTDTTFILRKQAFWVSCALIFWSVIFLFRVSLMYWLAENDHEFLIFLDKIFKISVVITYLFFFLAVTRKS